ncbi:hypothetical protein L2X99_15725 [Microbacterium sp. KUDC0406]|uniref:hypothetical protein n=1 Tax=Microbacterium sp. KUDC0406 TaxID=2909588 RepID=UPI001F2ADCDF|nr:hypothetical protein [Microbacterium sp. KUDC0406]UJP09810.1 hypothetical protein L2X99_15725 [Microbacterium sp. KUDC0406]
MSKLIELVGMLAPFAALVLLFLHRRRAAGPAWLGMIGAALAGCGSVAELIGSRVSWIGVSDMTEGLERLEGASLVRFALVVAGILLLLVAALIGGGRTVPRIPLAIGGVVAAAVGGAMRFVHLDLGDGGFARFVAITAVDLAQFGLLGFGVLLLGIAVISGRDDGPEPLDDAVRWAGAIARRVQSAHELRR